MKSGQQIKVSIHAFYFAFSSFDEKETNLCSRSFHGKNIQLLKLSLT